MKGKRNMRGLLLLSLFLIVSVLLLSGCGITSQADVAGKDIETQPIQKTTSLTTTNTKPAAFLVLDLIIEPREVQSSDYFSISIMATNTGGTQGNYDAILYIDEVNAEDPKNVITNTVRTLTKSVIIAAGESKKVTFDSISLQDGLYIATINELIDYFEVGC